MNKKEVRDKWFTYCNTCPQYNKQYNLFYDYTLFCYLNHIEIREWLNYIDIFLQEFRSNTIHKTRNRYKTYLRSYIDYVAREENVRLEREKNKLVIPRGEQDRILKNTMEKLGDGI